MKTILLSSLFVMVGACCHKPPVERIITSTVPVYQPVPEEYLICPLPPVIEPESIESEEDYNREFVLELYSNNITCFEAIRSVRAWNLEIQELNTDDSQ